MKLAQTLRSLQVSRSPNSEPPAWQTPTHALSLLPPLLVFTALLIYDYYSQAFYILVQCLPPPECPASPGLEECLARAHAQVLSLNSQRDSGRGGDSSGLFGNPQRLQAHAVRGLAAQREGRVDRKGKLAFQETPLAEAATVALGLEGS